MIKQELDRIKERISNKDFLENKGLSNEVGIHVFCYKAEDELIVQDYIRRLKSEVNTPYRIIECDLYEVFLWISCRRAPHRKLSLPRWTIHPISKGRMFSS